MRHENRAHIACRNPHGDNIVLVVPERSCPSTDGAKKPFISNRLKHPQGLQDELKPSYWLDVLDGLTPSKGPHAATLRQGFQKIRSQLIFPKGTVMCQQKHRTCVT